MKYKIIIISFLISILLVSCVSALEERIEDGDMENFYWFSNSWIKEVINNDADVYEAISQTPYNPHNGSFCVDLYAYNVTPVPSYAMIIQTVNFTDVNNLTYWYRFDLDLVADSTKVYVGGDLVANHNTTQDNWTQVTIDVSSYTGDHDLQFLLESNGDWGSEFYLDDVSALSSVSMFDGSLDVVADTLNGTYIDSLITYNDGTGNAIFGGTNKNGYLQKYNTSLGGWTVATSPQASITSIYPLAIYDDGTGDAIFGGTGTLAWLLKYNGSVGDWTQVAAQIDSQIYIFSIVAYDDGTGESLFGSTGNNGYLFKYNGSTGGWVKVADQLNSQVRVYSLVTYDDGTGKAIFGSTYTGARLFKYNGSTGGWVQVADQYSSETAVRALVTYDDGTGLAIFGTAGANLVKYNASLASWALVAAEPTGISSISSTIVFNDGSSESIYGGGDPKGNLYKYNNNTGGWVIAARNSENALRSFTTYDDGTGTTIYAGTSTGGYLLKFVFVMGDGGTPPVSNFSGEPTSGAYPLTVNFTDSSTNTPTSWYWEFGDGNTSTDENPTHEYSYIGTFTVSLNATNSAGSDIETKTDYVTVLPDPPVSAFSASIVSGTIPLSVTFTDYSTNIPTGWSWSFGDGGVSYLQNPTHEYSTIGTFTVSLTASNAGGSDVETKTDYITVSSAGSSGGPWGFTEPDYYISKTGLITYNATNVTDHIAVLNGNSPDENISAYFVIGTYSNHYSFMTEWQNVSGAYNETVNGMPLYPGKTFYYRAASQDGAYGEEKSFTVLDMDAFVETTYSQYADEFFDTDGDFIGMLMVVWEPYEDKWTELIFYGTLLSITFISIAWRQQSVIVSASLYTLIGWPLASLFPPEFYKIGAIMVCIAFGGFLYWVFTKTR